MAEDLGGYVLEGRIAVGGMAEVFRARRRGPAGFDKPLAIKRLLPDLARDPEIVAMFLDEARLASQLSSPNLVQVFDFGEADGAYFLAMELIDGLDLGALLQALGPLPAPLALFVGCELCRGLEALHGAGPGFVHRDVTPGNVLISVHGEAKLADFGIAKALARGRRTERGTIKGKLAYLSPEQARGDEADARSDVYGVGLILFELLTGERYLHCSTEAELLATAAQPVWRAPSQVREGVPARIDSVLQRTLAPEPALRFPDAAGLRSGLEGTGLGAASGGRDLLAAAVRRARGETAAEVGNRLPAPSPSPSVRPAPASAPRTERLQADPRSGRTWPKRLALAGLIAAGASMALLLRSRELPAPELPPTVSSTAAEPPKVEETVPRPVVTEPKPAPSPPVRPPKPAKAAARAEPAPQAPAPAAPTVAPGPSPEAVLAELDRAFTARGLLPEDAPELFTARSELATAAPNEGAVGQLRARIDAFAINRTFIQAKLERLNRRIESSGLPEAQRAELLRHSQAALSFAVTGRYAQANEKLNAIDAILLRGTPPGGNLPR